MSKELEQWWWSERRQSTGFSKRSWVLMKLSSWPKDSSSYENGYTSYDQVSVVVVASPEMNKVW